MRFTIKHDQNVIAEIEITNPEEWLTVEINGQPAIGFDCFYFDGTNDDFDGDTSPKVVVGCWTEPEGEEWTRLARFGLPLGPATTNAPNGPSVRAWHKERPNP